MFYSGEVGVTNASPPPFQKRCWEWKGVSHVPDLFMSLDNEDNEECAGTLTSEQKSPRLTRVTSRSGSAY